MSADLAKIVENNGTQSGYDSNEHKVKGPLAGMGDLNGPVFTG